jgi:hypothetical protein
MAGRKCVAECSGKAASEVGPKIQNYQWDPRSKTISFLRPSLFKPLGTRPSNWVGRQTLNLSFGEWISGSDTGKDNAQVDS